MLRETEEERIRSIEPLKSPWVKMGFLTCSAGVAALQPD